MRIQTLDSSTEIEQETQDFLTVWNDDSQSIIQLSSGSTGAPKAIEIPKWKMKTSAQMTGDFLNLSSCESALLCMSTNYIGGKMMVVRSQLLDRKSTRLNSSHVRISYAVFCLKKKKKKKKQIQ